MTLAEFRAIYPQFDSVPDAQVQAALDLFVCIYQGDYGCLADHLQGLFAAHQLAVSTAGGNGAVQTIASKSAGDVSISYAANGVAGDDLYSTKYGQEFSRLISLFGGVPVVSACGY